MIAGTSEGANKLIYLDNASAGLRANSVVEAQINHLRLEQDIGAPAAAAAATASLSGLYSNLGKLLNADPNSIAVTSSANAGLQTLLSALRLKPGSTVLVDRTCWGGSLAMVSTMAGVNIEVLPCDEFGTLDLEAAKRCLDRQPNLLLLTWASATNGIVHPAEQLGQLALAAGVPFMVDAAQIAGQRPIDVAALGCDALVATGRKWLSGPKGTGFLYASERFRALAPGALSDQHGMRIDGEGRWRHRDGALQYELGERNVSALLGLATAVQLALDDDVETRRRRLASVADVLRERIRAIDGITLHDQGADLGAIITLSCHDRSAIEVVDYLRHRGILAAAKYAVYAPLDMAARGLSEVVRLSPHWQLTEQHMDEVVDAIAGL